MKATGKLHHQGGRRPRYHDKRAAKLGRKEYEKELARLHAQLVQVQHWVQRTGAKICIVFEGRDGAGGQAKPIQPASAISLSAPML